MSAPPLRIGSLLIEPPALLAPMAGYTDTAFRTICRRQGCGMVFTEITNAAGLVRNSGRTWHLLETDPDENPIAAHIYGNDPAVMAAAAVRAEATGRFALIDVNAGCPVRRVTAKGSGAALMKNPEKIRDIVRAIRAAVSLPVTVKTRIGYSPAHPGASEIAQAVEEGGAAAIFVHARLASRGHAGPADWETLARLKAERRIPVVGNGGIGCAEDAVRMLADTGVDGVMIGRAAMGNPWIFREVLGRLAGDPSPAPPTVAERRAVVAEHLARQIELSHKAHAYRRRSGFTDEQAGVLYFRGHLLRYVSGFRNVGLLRRQLNDFRSVQGVMEAVDQVLGGGR